MPLEPKDQRHLCAAQGFSELGMFLDATEELERIESDVRHLPEVLAVRLTIYEALKKWELMQAVAKSQVQNDPDNVQWWISLANATRRTESLEIAKVILLEAVRNHPKMALIHYNLACYECQLGDVSVGKQHLDRAFKLDPKLRIKALDDGDLAVLWLMAQE